MKRLWYLLLFLLGLFLISYGLSFYILREATGATWREVLLQGGTVIDGTGKEGFQADLLIRDGKIAAVGQGLEAAPGARIVDAQGALLMPGFIQLLDQPLPLSRVQQELAFTGITTLVCRAGRGEVPSGGQQLNYGLLLGVGELQGVDDPRALVRSRLANGFLGLTMDLESPEDGVVSLKDLLSMLDQISPHPLLVAHLPADLSLDPQQLSALLNSIRLEDGQLPCTLYLREFRLGKNCSGEDIAQLQESLARAGVRGDLNPFVLCGMPPYTLIGAFGRFPADEIYFAQTPPELHYLQGKSLAEAACEGGLSAAELAAQLCDRFSGGSELLVEVLETGGERALGLPPAFCWQAPPGLLYGAERELPQFLELLEGMDSPGALAEGVARLTSFPAELLGIEGRGKLIQGAYADLLVVRRGEEGFSLESVFINGRPLLLDGRGTGYSSGTLVHGL